MAGLSRQYAAGRMDFGTLTRMAVSYPDTSRKDGARARREFVSVSTAILSQGSGAGKTFV